MRERWEETEVKLYGKRVVSPSRDPRCNGVIGYELTGPRSLSWRGSRRRKLVEGNRFITRDRHRGRRGRAELGRERKRREKHGARFRALFCTNDDSTWTLAFSSSLAPPLCFWRIYTPRALCCPRSLRSLLHPCFAPRLRGLSTSSSCTWTSEEAETHNRAARVVYLLFLRASAYRGKPYRAPHLFSIVCLFAQESHARSGSPLA